MASFVPAREANAALRQQAFTHPPKDFTIKRNEQRQMETLALTESLGTWITWALQEEGVVVRGADGFFEDLESGAVLCKLLKRLGVPVEKPKENPRNDFERRENKQKYCKACMQAKFSSIPSFENDPVVGLLPSLLECAAISQAQHSALPDALSKRLSQGIDDSQAIKDAREGRMVAESSHSVERVDTIENTEMKRRDSQVKSDSSSNISRRRNKAQNQRSTQGSRREQATNK